MNESLVNPRPRIFNSPVTRWSPEHPASETVRPANRTELRGALEADEVLFSLMEILPDYSRCGINE